jgi:glutathione peroxidase
MRYLFSAVAICLAGPLFAAAQDITFNSIDGGTLSLDDWKGQPVLVVNTASMCGFTPQFAALQELYDTYRNQGLVVLAVPSDDFNQELSSSAEVKDFCQLQYGIDLPMTDITHVRGDQAHPFYRDVLAQTGFAPGWNFNKVLMDGQGQVIGTWGAPVQPMSDTITGPIKALLN